MTSGDPFPPRSEAITIGDRITELIDRNAGEIPLWPLAERLRLLAVWFEVYDADQEAAATFFDPVSPLNSISADLEMAADLLDLSTESGPK